MVRMICMLLLEASGAWLGGGGGTTSRSLSLSPRSCLGAAVDIADVNGTSASRSKCFRKFEMRCRGVKTLTWGDAIDTDERDTVTGSKTRNEVGGGGR